MQVPIPLAPPATGTPGGPAVPVANAPNAPQNGKPESPRPVTASKHGERARGEGERPRSADDQGQRRGERLDIFV